MNKMKRFLIPALLAATLAIGTIGVAQAQMSGQRNNQNQQNDQRYDRGGWGCGGYGHRGGGYGHMRGNGGHMGMGYRGDNMRGDRQHMRGYYGDDSGMFLSPVEMNKYHNEMRNAKNVNECQKIDATHQKLIEQRAKAEGVAVTKPSFDICTDMEKNGWFTN